MSASGFDNAARQITVRAAAGEAPERDDLNTVLAGLRRFLAARFSGLGSEEIEDVATESINRYWLASTRKLVDLEQRPGAYLTQIARHLAYERLNALRVAADPRSAGEGKEDINLEGVLDRDAARAQLDKMRCRAIEVGDHVAVQVITAWLDVAEERDVAPTSRQVAKHAGLSHATVNRALARLRRRLT